MENEKLTIKGGAFQVARKLFESDLWVNKPVAWKVIWIYILGNVSFKKTKNLERGEGFFQWSKEIKSVGKDIKIDSIKKFTAYAVGYSMIATTRSTRGVYIKVLKYNEYQTINNYASTAGSTREALEKHQRSTTIIKNGKNEKKEKKYLEEIKEKIQIQSGMDITKERRKELLEKYKPKRV